MFAVYSALLKIQDKVRAHFKPRSIRLVNVLEPPRSATKAPQSCSNTFHDTIDRPRRCLKAPHGPKKLLEDTASHDRSVLSLFRSIAGTADTPRPRVRPSCCGPGLGSFARVIWWSQAPGGPDVSAHPRISASKAEALRRLLRTTARHSLSASVGASALAHGTREDPREHRTSRCIRPVNVSEPRRGGRCIQNKLLLLLFLFYFYFYFF